MGFIDDELNRWRSDRRHDCTASMRIVFIGAGGHGKVCAEIAELTGYSEIFFLDDDKEQKVCGKHRVSGIAKEFSKFVDSYTAFFVSIGNTDIRQRIQERIEHIGGRIATLIHPNAVISKDVNIGTGSVVMAGTVINGGTVIGSGVIVNTSSSIDHDCIVGNYCHVAVGSHLCGTVKVGNCTWIGAGAVVNNNLNICGNCIIGSGAVVVKDIKRKGNYIGVPARRKD